MAKTESTAVNDLIKLVETATPLKPDPSEDLMFKAPEKPSSKKVSPPRFTSTIPAIKGAGEVAPLPRQRAPHGTQRGVPTVNEPNLKATALGVAPVRMSTAPARANTIPPIPTPPQNLLDRLTRPSGDMADGTKDHPAVPRTTRPSLPPPRPSAQLRTEAPPNAPVAAPFPDLPLQYPSAAPYMEHVVPDMTSNQAWFDQSALDNAAAVDVDLADDISGTARVAKTTDWKALIPKLIAPTLGLVLVGVFVGGYIAFDSAEKGGRKAHAATATTPDTAKAIAPVAEPAQPDKLEAKAEPKTEPAVDPKTEPAVGPSAQDVGPSARDKISEAKTEPKTAEPIAPVGPSARDTTEVKTEPKLDATPAVVAPAVSGRPTFVDIRIDSKPAGATVMLVDRGKTTFLGSTPISTAVDPSREYDVILTIDGKSPQVEHIVPSKMQRLSVTLGKSSKTEKVAPVVAKIEAPKPAAKVETPKAAPKVEAPKPAAKKIEKAVVDPFAGKDTKPETKPEAKPESKTEPKPEAKPVDPKPEAKPAPAGDGILMISSKPPCEIYVDGAPTGLSTPQRAMKLPAGKHKITLVNTVEKIKKTISVTIGEEPTKVIENFMQ